MTADGETRAGSLRNISDTALWVAAYRAEETERSDALFRDPLARRLAEPRGFELLSAMPHGRQLAWPMVMRTMLLDRMILDGVEKGLDLVLNLAAGLDTRPYRMALPHELRWVEVDLPEMIAYKTQRLAGEQPNCRVERLALDLADIERRRAMLGEVAARGTNGLVMTEGLLIYLAEGDVEALADDLAATSACRWWAVDFVSPRLLERLQQSWGAEVDRAGAPFRFAPQDGPAFFARHGWRTVGMYSSLHAAARMKRLPFWLAALARLFPESTDWKPRRVWGGVCLFERA